MVDFFKDLSFFILPLGLGSKRIEFFETQVEKYKGNIVKNDAATHVIFEESVSGSKNKCLNGMKKHNLCLKRDVKYVSTKWLSKCFSAKSLVSSKEFELEWAENEIDNAEGKNDTITDKKGGDECEEAVVPEKKQKMNFDKFLCTQSSASSSTSLSPNKQKVIDELQKLADAFRVKNDQWRAYGYDKAVKAISRYDKEISSYQEARNIPGVSENMAQKIMEVIEYGKLQKVEEVCNDEKYKILDVFHKIWGAGPTAVEAWYSQGYRTLDDLRSKAKLTKQQLIGLKHYDDLLKRIPREEVEQIGNIVEEEMKKINSSLEVVLVGSYRRGKPDCGDIDVMVVNPGHITATDILVQVVSRLKQRGVVTDDLFTLEEVGNHRKYFGVCKLGADDPHRRLDIFVVPKSEYAAALMHFTGSANFNRSIRLLASKKQMKLTESGLYKDVIQRDSELTTAQLVPTPTEEDIFITLGLDYKSPQERDH